MPASAYFPISFFGGVFFSVFFMRLPVIQRRKTADAHIIS